MTQCFRRSFAEQLAVSSREAAELEDAVLNQRVSDGCRCRNKLLVAMGSALGLTLVVATIVSATARLSAERAAEEARQNLVIANEARAAEQKQAELAREREREARIEEARALKVAEFAVGILKSVDQGVAKTLDTELMEQTLSIAAARVDREFAEDPMTAAYLHSAIGNTYSTLGQYDKSDEHLDESLRLYESAPRQGGILMYCALANLGKLRHAQGRLDEAVKMHRKSVEGYTEEYGVDHADTLLGMADLADALNDAGLAKESSEVYGQILEAMDRVELEDSLVVRILHTYGIVLEREAKWSDAKRVQLRALELARKVLGEDHPTVLLTLNSLAVIHMNLGELDEADAIYGELLESFKSVRGEDHPHTLAVYGNMAKLAFRRGQLDVAEERFRKALAAFERVVGPGHPYTLITRSSLGSVLSQQGRRDEAIELRRETLELSREHLGPENPNTLTEMNSLARDLHLQGQLDEAEALFREALAVQREGLGETHPSTMSTRQNLTLLILDRGDNEQAEGLLVELVDGYRQNGPPDQLDRAIGRLGQLQLDMERFVAAEATCREWLELRKKTYGAGNSKLAAAQRRIGLALCGQERYGDAEPQLLEAYDAVKDDPALPVDTHREMLQTLIDLYTALGQPDTAAIWGGRLDDLAPQD